MRTESRLPRKVKKMIFRTIDIMSPPQTKLVRRYIRHARKEAKALYAAGR